MLHRYTLTGACNNSSFTVKVALLFPINKFHKTYFKGLTSYNTINPSNEGICVEFLRKKDTILVYLLSNFRQVLNYFKTSPITIIFDDFSIQ